MRDDQIGHIARMITEDPDEVRQPGADRYPDFEDANAQPGDVRLISGNLNPYMASWDDPGDYPSNAGSGPLPSYSYVEDVEGSLSVLISDPNTIQILSASTGHLADNLIEDVNPDLHELLDQEVPSGINVQHWAFTMIKSTPNGNIYEFKVADFEDDGYGPEDFNDEENWGIDEP